MQKQTPFEIQWLTLCAAFPNARISDQQAIIYSRAMQDVRPEHLEYAVAKCIQVSEWFPTVALLRKYAEAAPYSLYMRRATLEAIGALAQLESGNP